MRTKLYGRILSAMLFGTLVAWTACVTADEQEIRSAVSNGLDDYHDDVTQLQKEIRIHFEGLTEKARTKGDAKEVDALSDQRLRFDTFFVLPKSFPEAFRKRQETSIKRTERVFDNAKKSALKERLDQLSERIDSEKTEFLMEIRPILKLTATPPEKVSVFRGWYTADGRSLLGERIGGTITFSGKEYKEAILAHPPRDSYSELVFPLNGGWEFFDVRVGLPHAQDDPMRKKAGSIVTFEVRADDKAIWTSNGTDDINTLQVCRVAVPPEAKKLRLRAHLGSDGHFARATWVEPRLSSFRYKTVGKTE